MPSSWHLSFVYRFFSRIRFEDEDMERAYQGQVAFHYLALMQYLGTILSVGSVLFTVLRGASLDWFKGHPIAFALHFLPPITGIVLLLASIKVEWSGKHCRKFIQVAATVMVCYAAWSAAFMGSVRVDAIPKDFPKVWSALEAYPEARDELINQLSDDLLLQQVWFHLVMVLYYLCMLQYLGFNYGAVAVYTSLPACFSITIFMLTKRMHHTVDVVLHTTSISFLLATASFYWSHTHRRRFQLDHELRQTLAKEAQAMESLAHQEKAHKETSQHADTILNHILKNMMADAAGCIHLYMDSLLGEHPKDLLQAVTCLDRGMSWCRKRQALLQVTSQRYVPTLSPVSLREFAVDVVSGRAVKYTCIDALVNLDKVLCEIVLDNAISNAFRHGHPDDPQVTLSITLSQPLSDEQSTLTFVVTNRANPLKPPLTPCLISQILAGELRSGTGASSCISEQIGLQHMFMAAETHKMSLSLQQQGDAVELQASMLVTLGPEERTAAPTSTCSISQLPAGLHILCIDDSPVARRFLMNILCRHFVGCTVEVYGQDAKEIDTFMHNALRYANIAILDQFLEYGSTSFTGTDLLQTLITRGYSGFACIRSANVSHDNQAEFLQTGAHCALGKDIRPQDMVRLISTSFAQYIATHQLASEMDLPISAELTAPCNLPGSVDIS